ncbi:MAG TPA: hypothetical protein VHA82_14820 [Ramlibacter sp.]|uniref:hypothetical protein n=1 Tax=Ramlibacter sp. TaxID=1917967 RepID=UPI002D1C9F9C|nr:hypothetical protein [Ramlibacter sp.]HVZ45081.1 hypothetical protein [Ramlibacter sp.]
MSDSSTSDTGTGACAAAGRIADFFRAALALAQADAKPGESIVDLARRRHEARGAFASITQNYEKLCGDAAVTGCAPLARELHEAFCHAADATRRIEEAWHRTLEGIENDCRAMIVSIQALRAAVVVASHTVASSQAGYEAASAAYRDAVARGTRVRSLLAAAETHTEFGQIAFRVGVLLQRASDAFGSFLCLHEPPLPRVPGS